MRFTYFFILFLVLTSFGYAQEKYIFSAIEKLPSGINSESEESMPVLSSDGNTLFFTRSLYDRNVGGTYSGQDIWCSHRRADGTWATANNVFPKWNDKGNNAVVGLNEKGSTAYLLNTLGQGKKQGLSFSRFLGSEWNDPEAIKLKGISKTGFLGYFVSPDYKVILTSMNSKDSNGEDDIYVILKDTITGEWGEPINLGATINTPGFEISPFLSEDTQTLFFASNGHAGFGDADIYYSKRQFGSWEVWSKPVNVGPVINSSSFDAYMHINSDSLAYFVSNRDSEYSDIYLSHFFKTNLDIQTGAAPKSTYSVISPEEMKELLGTSNFNANVSFNPTEVALSAKDREVLFYLSSQLRGKPEYELELIAMSNDKRLDAKKFEQLQRRIAAVREVLIEGGVDYARIRAQSLSDYSESEKEVVRIEILKPAIDKN